MNWWVLRRRPHVSWLIAILSIAVLIGVYVDRYIQSPMFAPLAWLTISIALIGVSLTFRYIYLIPCLIIGGVCFGIWRGAIMSAELIGIQSSYGQTMVIEGHVREDVDSDAAGRLSIRLDKLTVGNKDIPGALWVSTKTDVTVKRSDIVTVTGKIDKGFGSFIATMYQAKIVSVKRSAHGDIARDVRDWFADAVRNAIPEPQASLGIGYLVGQKRALPNDLAEALQIAGLTHVVVASGYNLTILVRLARRLFEKVSKYLSTLSSAVMIASFVAITGLSPSMSRAGLVASLSLAAWYYGRRFHPLILLAFAAAVTVIINPSYLWGDLGWQLSFAAFGGVMILAPLLQRFFFGEKKPGIIRQILGETTAAIIVTAPILVNAFGQFSNVAVIANLLVLPLVPLAMLLTFIAGIGALLFPAIATIIGLPASWLLGYMTSVAQYLSHVSWAVSTIQISSIVVVICYVLLIALCIYLWHVTKFDLKNANIIE